MRSKLWIVLPLAILVAMFFVGCEGEQGPEGPAGPQGPPGEDATAVEYTYLGGAESCTHCHAGAVASWEETLHATDYAGLTDAEDLENFYCLKCHTTGWDATAGFGQTEFTDENPNDGADMYGYDNYIGDDSEEGMMRKAELGMVGCEACHGPMGPEFNAHEPELSFATRMTDDGEHLSSCYPCHEGQINEWGGYGEGEPSGHSLAAGGDHDVFMDEHYAHGSCSVCHSSEGFIGANDPAYADFDFHGQASFIGCVTCHDPHDDTNAAQLRNVGDVEMNFSVFAPEEAGPTMSGYGTAQTCAQCHQARRDTDHVNGQIEEGYGHFGPHSSPQADMFIGYGSYEIDGMTYEGRYDGDGTTHQAIADACVSCHMVQEVEQHGELQDHSFHTFEPTLNNCQTAGCHGSATEGDFPNIGGGQDDIEALMNDLAPMLSTANYTFTTWEDFSADASDWSTDELTTTSMREAGYALIFVISDGTMGLHNPAYAASLLNNAIDYLSLN